MNTEIPYNIYQKKLDKEILRRASFMSDTKWYKLFEAFLIEKIPINGSKIKFLLDNKMYNFDIGVLEENYMDAICGAFYFKEIEWIFIPQKIEIERFNRQEKLVSKHKENLIDEIEKMMTNLGQFHYEKDENGLKIYGYK